jgi:hypothetical protein
MSASVNSDHLAVGVRNWPAEPMPFDEATAVPVWLSVDTAPGHVE